MPKTQSLLAAAERVWETYLAYGPVDDDRPEGDEFSAALDALMEAAAVLARVRQESTRPTPGQ
jgi:hypothetical protein